MKELHAGTKPPQQAHKEMQAWSLGEGSERADPHSELGLTVQGLMLLVPGRRCFTNDKRQAHSHPSGLPWPNARTQGTGCSLDRVKSCQQRAPAPWVTWLLSMAHLPSTGTWLSLPGQSHQRLHVPAPSRCCFYCCAHKQAPARPI